MAATFQISNPIWWVQVQIQGGPRRILSWSAAYALFLTVVWIVWRRFMQQTNNPIPTASEALMGLSFLQMALILFGGCTSISRAVARDNRTQMIESHRLTPMDSGTVMIGYLLGPNLLILSIFFTGMLFGVLLCILGKFSPVDWLKGSAFLLLTALNLWSLVIFTGLAVPRSKNPGGVLFALGALGQLWVLMLPGAALAFGAYALFYAYRIMNSRIGVVSTATGMMLLVNVIMIGVWLSVSARKYRRPDLPAFDPLRAMILLFLWLVLSVAAILHFTELFGTGFHANDMSHPQSVLALIISLFVAFLPLYAAVTASVRALRGGRPATWAERLPGIVVILSCVGLTVGLLAATLTATLAEGLPESFSGRRADRWAICAVSITLALLAMDGLWRWQLLRRSSARAGTLVLILVAWGLPIGIDFFLANYKAQTSVVDLERLPLTALFGCSPIGTLIAAWSEIAIPFAPGLAFQASLAAVTQLIGRRTMRAEIRRRALATPE